MNKLTLLIGGVLLTGVAFVYWNSQQAPTTGHSMIPPDTSKIAAGDPIVDVKLPAEFSAKAKIGKLAFDAKCSACHGKNGAGRNGSGPPFIHKTYRPGHHGDTAFLFAAKNGVQSHHWRFGNMPPVQGLTDADVMGIATYIREIQRENGIN